MKSIKPDKKKQNDHKKKPDNRFIQHIMKIDQKIEANIQEFIDWVEKEKNKVY